MPLRENAMEKKSGRSPATYAILAWFIVNIIFMILEVTTFGDAADLNDWIILVLSAVSFAGLFTMKKLGAAAATFSLIYMFSFNAFNVIYFSPFATTLNGTSAIINAIATVYMFKSIFAGRFR